MDESATVKWLADRAKIYDVMCRYARGIDRGDADLIRAAYHPDAYDDHVHYRGDIEGFIAVTAKRMEGVDNSMHFLGNCLIEFAGPDLAMVETYFASRRTRAPDGDEAAGLASNDAICRQQWGRYLDRFERRNREWRIAKRLVVVDARFNTVAKAGARDSPLAWGTRGRSDPYYAFRADIFRDDSNRPN